LVGLQRCSAAYSRLLAVLSGPDEHGHSAVVISKFTLTVGLSRFRAKNCCRFGCLMNAQANLAVQYASMNI